MGAERFLVLGWCGSIQPFLEIGDLVIPTHAVSEEGTSQHYATASENPPSDASLIRILETRLEGRKTPFTKGPIWTTDAIYRETPEKVKAYQQQNILAVEMEISALAGSQCFSCRTNGGAAGGLRRTLLVEMAGPGFPTAG